MPQAGFDWEGFLRDLVRLVKSVGCLLADFFFWL